MLDHILIIGAGGVATYLIKPLVRTFRPKIITIYDKDTLEQRNLERQDFPGHEEDGIAKANLICLMAAEVFKQLKSADHEIHVKNEWFTDTTKLPDGVNLIICIADNHQARRAALKAGDDNGIPVILGGNEYFDSEAYVYFPEWSGDKLRDPRLRYDLSGNEGSPLRCNADEALEATPQLAIANLGCAHKILSLIWLHWRWAPENGVLGEARNKLPFELSNTVLSSAQLP